MKGSAIGSSRSQSQQRPLSRQERYHAERNYNMYQSSYATQNSFLNNTIQSSHQNNNINVDMSQEIKEYLESCLMELWYMTEYINLNKLKITIE